MDNAKIISENGIEILVNGIFYIFNSKYYFIYTEKETDENNYVKLYVSQVCKEIQNTPSGMIDTGNMLGMEITNSEEWVKVQESITMVVEDKKNSTQNSSIQYLPIGMLTNLKILGKNKFKLMKNIIEDNFKLSIAINNSENKVANNILPIQPLQTTQTIDSNINNETIPLENLSQTNSVNQTNIGGDVIIDYRTKFFEEQEKNENLQEQIKILNQKLDSIKNILE